MNKKIYDNNTIINKKSNQLKHNQTDKLFEQLTTDIDDTVYNNTTDIALECSAGTLWKNCLEIIKDNVSVDIFNTWFLPIRAKSWENNRLTVNIPTSWYQEWIEEHYYQLLDMTIKRVLGEKAELYYEINIVDSLDIEPAKLQSPALKNPPFATTMVAQQNVRLSNINPRYAFETFVVGESNQLAINAANAVAKATNNTRFNPFFIYGGSGLGKTHLAQAIGNYIMKNNANKKCLYISSEQFVMDFVEQATSNDSKKKNEFNNIYRNLDLLIVDDIQFLSGKSGTQDKFFHIFNTLYQEGKQIILTSDKAPRDIKDIDDRLISRFIAGLNIEIRPPDFSHRTELVRRKSSDEGIMLSNEIIDYIALNVTKSVREIEGVLIKLIAMVTLDFRPISLELVQEVVSGLATEPKPISLDEIKEKVGTFYNISCEQMNSKTRKREIALARQMAMYFIRKLTNTSLKIVGESFGGRDHATVLHSCQVIENYVATDRKVKAEYEMLESIFKNR